MPGAPEMPGSPAPWLALGRQLGAPSPGRQVSPGVSPLGELNPRDPRGQRPNTRIYEDKENCRPDELKAPKHEAQNMRSDGQQLRQQVADLADREIVLVAEWQRVQDQARHAEEREQDLDVSAMRLHEQADALSAREALAAEEQHCRAAAAIKLAEREDLLAIATRQLQEREAAAAAMEELLKEQEFALNKDRALIDKHDAAAATTAQRLAEQEGNLSLRERRATELEHAANQRGLALEVIVEREAGLAAATQQLDDRHRTLTEREARATEREERLASEEERLTTSCVELAERQEAVTNAERVVARAKALAAEREEAAAKAEGDAVMARKLAEQETSRARTLAEKEAQLLAEESELVARQQHFTARERALDETRAAGDADVACSSESRPPVPLETPMRRVLLEMPSTPRGGQSGERPTPTTPFAESRERAAVLEARMSHEGGLPARILSRARPSAGALSSEEGTEEACSRRLPRLTARKHVQELVPAIGVAGEPAAQAQGPNAATPEGRGLTRLAGPLAAALSFVRRPSCSEANSFIAATVEQSHAA